MSNASYGSHIINLSSALSDGDEVVDESFVRVMFKKIANILRMKRN